MVSNVTISDVYNVAADLVEEHWITGIKAKDFDGYPISPLDNRAYSFCALGAIERAAYDLGVPVETLASWNFIEPLYELIDCSITEWNDNKAIDGKDVAETLRKAGSRA